jgi:hypothetical protein
MSVKVEKKSLYQNFLSIIVLFLKIQDSFNSNLGTNLFKINDSFLLSFLLNKMYRVNPTQLLPLYNHLLVQQQVK